MPYIYLRQLINVISIAGLKGLDLIFMWIVSGIFFLLFFAAQDMFQFVKILCDYKMDDDLNNKMLLEDQNQDRMVIYDEILNVMKVMYFLF